MRNITAIIYHHTASSRDNTTLEQVNEWHKSRWPKFESSLGYHVGYHYVIGKDWIKQTRAWKEIGAHAYGHNEESIGIALTGNFETETPNKYQLKELQKLVQGLMSEFELTPAHIQPHSAVSSTACPGAAMKKSLIFPKEKEEPKQDTSSLKKEIKRLVDLL